MTIDPEVVAYHEAGHAVAAHEFDMVIEKISIQSDGDDAGHVIHEYGRNMNTALHEGECERQIAIEQAAIVALAGEAAQRRFRPESLVEEHGEGDRESVHFLLGVLVADHDDELRDAWRRVLAIRADRLIALRWKRVEWLAAAILQHTIIEDVDEIRHVILDADLPTELRGRRLSPTERLKVLLGRIDRASDSRP